MNDDNEKREQNYKKFRKIIKQLRPIDDIFMRALFMDNLPLAEYVLRIITGMPDLRLIKENTQYDLPGSPGGRSVCLDVLAEDGDGRLYDLEIQRSDNGASPKRARFHSAAMDTAFLKKGEDFDSLHETYIIFITEKDYFGKGELACHFVRTSLSDGMPLQDGTHILYLNASYNRPEDNSELALLMHDFLCADPKDMHCEMIAKFVDDCKNAEKGERNMCKEFDDLIEEIVNEEKHDMAIKQAKKMLAYGALPVDKIAEFTELPVEMIEQLAKEMQTVTV